ncbi:MAG: filamentous hemagglutinin N-terminal domain-containing protein [Phycisphaerae bacterium]
MTRSSLLARASFFLNRLSVPAAIALAAGCVASAHAGPEGEQVRQGSVRFVRDGNNTTIYAGDRSIINYRSFNIGSNESVRFVQPDAGSRVLNRITSAAPTRIDGNLSANGRVYIVNPAGVVFGRSSVINVNGLFAAAGNMSDGDFNRGIDRVTGMTGRVANEGLIRVDQGGTVLLAGGQVANMGNIVAPQGTVAMAAGTDVVFTSRNDVMHVRVSGPAQGDSQNAAVTNTGTIDARRGQVTMAAGDVYGLAIRTDGQIIARDTTIAGQGTGRVLVEGSIDGVNQASDTAWSSRFDRRNVTPAKGGTITITGETVGLFAATLDVSGTKGGGQVRIGGDIMGTALAGDLRNSTVTVADSATTIRADATQRGDGGSVVLWADDTTRTAAAISAKGGERGGDGGFIETSGKQHLAVDGSRIDASAARGDAGTWLLDPRNVNITSGTTNVTISGTNPEVFTPSLDDSEVSAADIVSRLNNGTSVTINTGSDGAQDGDIRIQADIVRNAASGSPTLRLEAANDIVLESNRRIEAIGGGSLNVEMLANRGAGDLDPNAGSIWLQSGSSIETRGGNILLAGGNVSNPTLGDPTSTGYTSALLDSAARGSSANPVGIRLEGTTVDAGSGSVTVRGVGADGVDGAQGVRVQSTVLGATVRIDGLGGGSSLAGTGLGNNGVLVSTGGSVRSTGALTVHGTGGATAEEDMVGVLVRLGGEILAQNAGNAQTLSVFGVGGSGAGVRNHGVSIEGSSQIRHAGTGALTVRGEAAGTGNISHGVAMATTANAIVAEVASENALTVTGLSGTGLGSYGVLITGNGGDPDILAGGASAARSVSITGEARGGFSRGLGLTSEAGIVGTGVSITAFNRDGANNGDQFTGIGGDAGSINARGGDFNIIADSIALEVIDLLGTGNLTFRARDGVNMNVGVLFSGFSINNAELDNIASGATGFNSVTFNAGTSDLSVEAVDFSARGYDVTLAGSEVNINDLTMAAADQVLTLEALDVGQQSGRLVAGQLVLTGNGRYELTNAGNDIVTLAGNPVGSVNISDTNGIVVGTIGARSGLSSGQGAVTFASAANGITLSGPVSGTVVTFNSPVLLGVPVANVTGTTSITFNGTIDSVAGENHSIQLVSPATRFNDVIGGTQRIGLIETDAAGTTTIATSSISTVGDIIFGDAVVLASNVTLISDANIQFLASVNSDSTARSLFLNAGDAADFSSIFEGTVGATGALASIDGLDGSVVSFADNVTTTGTQTYTGRVVAAGDLTLTANGFSFGEGLDSDATSRDVIVNAGGGAVTFFGNVGKRSQLRSLTVTGSTIRLRDVATGLGQRYVGQTFLNGEVTAASGLIEFVNEVRLTGNSSVRNFGSGANDDIFFRGLVNGVDGSFDLSVRAEGDVLFEGGVGTGTATGLQAIRNLTVRGGSIGLRAVRTAANQTFTGATTLNGDLTTTGPGNILIDGTGLLRADLTVTTNAGDITFGAALDSEDSDTQTTGKQGFDLIANTGGSGTTRFNDVNSIGTITTNADGVTVLAGRLVRTNGDVLFSDSVRLAANTVLEANDVTFEGTLNSDATTSARNITITTSTVGTDAGETIFRGVVGGVARLGTLTTTGSGPTIIGANVNTLRNITFGGPVRIGASNVTIDAAGGTILFRGALDADTSVTDPTLSLLSVAPGGLTTTNFRFGGSIGATRRLGSLRIGADRGASEAATIVFTDSFDADGRITASSVAAADAFSIIVGAGGLQIGANQRVTALGALTITSAGAVTFGDLNTLGNLNVTASAININRRGNSSVRDRSNNLVPDAGTAVIAGGTMTFSRRPVFQGTGNDPSFAIGSGTIDSDLQGFIFRTARPAVNTALFTDAANSTIILPLDLPGSGPSATTITTAVRDGVNVIASPAQPQQLLAGASDLALLNELGIETRGSTIDEIVDGLSGRRFSDQLPVAGVVGNAAPIVRVNAASAQRAVDAYRTLMLVPVTDEAGAPLLDEQGNVQYASRTDTVRRVLEESWNRYAALVSKPTGEGWRAYLDTQGTTGDAGDRQALAMLNEIRTALDAMDDLGLAPDAVAAPKARILGSIKPAIIPTEADFLDAIYGFGRIAAK